MQAKLIEFNPHLEWKSRNFIILCEKWNLQELPYLSPALPFISAPLFACLTQILMYTTSELLIVRKLEVS